MIKSNNNLTKVTSDILNIENFQNLDEYSSYMKPNNIVVASYYMNVFKDYKEYSKYSYEMYYTDSNSYIQRLTYNLTEGNGLNIDENGLAYISIDQNTLQTYNYKNRNTLFVKTQNLNSAYSNYQKGLVVGDNKQYKDFFSNSKDSGFVNTNDGIISLNEGFVHELLDLKKYKKSILELSNNINDLFNNIFEIKKYYVGDILYLDQNKNKIIDSENQYTIPYLICVISSGIVEDGYPRFIKIEDTNYNYPYTVFASDNTGFDNIEKYTYVPVFDVPLSYIRSNSKIIYSSYGFIALDRNDWAEEENFKNKFNNIEYYYCNDKGVFTGWYLDASYITYNQPGYENWTIKEGGIYTYTLNNKVLENVPDLYDLSDDIVVKYNKTLKKYKVNFKYNKSTNKYVSVGDSIATNLNNINFTLSEELISTNINWSNILKFPYKLNDNEIILTSAFIPYREIYNRANYKWEKQYYIDEIVDKDNFSSYEEKLNCSSYRYDWEWKSYYSHKMAYVPDASYTYYNHVNHEYEINDKNYYYSGDFGGDLYNYHDSHKDKYEIVEYTTYKGPSQVIYYSYIRIPTGIYDSFTSYDLNLSKNYTYCYFEFDNNLDINNIANIGLKIEYIYNTYLAQYGPQWKAGDNRVLYNDLTYSYKCTYEYFIYKSRYMSYSFESTDDRYIFNPKSVEYYNNSNSFINHLYDANHNTVNWQTSYNSYLILKVPNVVKNNNKWYQIGSPGSDVEVNGANDTEFKPIVKITAYNLNDLSSYYFIGQYDIKIKTYYDYNHVQHAYFYCNKITDKILLNNNSISRNVLKDIRDYSSAEEGIVYFRPDLTYVTLQQTENEYLYHETYGHIINKMYDYAMTHAEYYLYANNVMWDYVKGKWMITFADIDITGKSKRCISIYDPLKVLHNFYDQTVLLSLNITASNGASINDKLFKCTINSSGTSYVDLTWNNIKDYEYGLDCQDSSEINTISFNGAFTYNLYDRTKIRQAIPDFPLLPEGKVIYIDSSTPIDNDNQGGNSGGGSDSGSGSGSGSGSQQTYPEFKPIEYENMWVVQDYIEIGKINEKPNMIYLHDMAIGLKLNSRNFGYHKTSETSGEELTIKYDGSSGIYILYFTFTATNNTNGITWDDNDADNNVHRKSYLAFTFRNYSEGNSPVFKLSIPETLSANNHKDNIEAGTSWEDTSSTAQANKRNTDLIKFNIGYIENEEDIDQAIKDLFNSFQLKLIGVGKINSSITKTRQVIKFNDNYNTLSTSDNIIYTIKNYYKNDIYNDVKLENKINMTGRVTIWTAFKYLMNYKEEPPLNTAGSWPTGISIDDTPKKLNELYEPKDGYNYIDSTSYNITLAGEYELSEVNNVYDIKYIGTADTTNNDGDSGTTDDGDSPTPTPQPTNYNVTLSCVNCTLVEGCEAIKTYTGEQLTWEITLDTGYTKITCEDNNVSIVGPDNDNHYTITWNGSELTQNITIVVSGVPATGTYTLTFTWDHSQGDISNLTVNNNQTELSGDNNNTLENIMSNDVIKFNIDANNGYSVYSVKIAPTSFTQGQMIGTDVTKDETNNMYTVNGINGNKTITIIFIQTSIIISHPDRLVNSIKTNYLTTLKSVVREYNSGSDSAYDDDNLILNNIIFNNNYQASGKHELALDDNVKPWFIFNFGDLNESEFSSYITLYKQNNDDSYSYYNVFELKLSSNSGINNTYILDEIYYINEWENNTPKITISDYISMFNSSNARISDVEWSDFYINESNEGQPAWINTEFGIKITNQSDKTYRGYISFDSATTLSYVFLVSQNNDTEQQSVDVGNQSGTEEHSDDMGGNQHPGSGIGT